MKLGIPTPAHTQLSYPPSLLNPALLHRHGLLSQIAQVQYAVELESADVDGRLGRVVGDRGRGGLGGGGRRGSGSLAADLHRGGKALRGRESGRVCTRSVSLSANKGIVGAGTTYLRALGRSPYRLQRRQRRWSWQPRRRRGEPGMQTKRERWFGQPRHRRPSLRLRGEPG